MLILQSSPQRVFLISDTHFGHDRDFVYAKRGFSSIEEMNETIVQNWNEVVQPEDIVFHLGDVYMLDEKNVDYLARLNGEIHLIRGNHDTDHKVQKMLELGLIKSAAWADTLHYHKKHFYMSHYPTLCSDTALTLENLEKSLRDRSIGLYGHTHQQTNFWNDVPWVYHVGVDSHGCRPILLDDAYEEIKAKREEKLAEARKAARATAECSEG